MKLFNSFALSNFLFIHIVNCLLVNLFFIHMAVSPDAMLNISFNHDIPFVFRKNLTDHFDTFIKFFE